ASGTPSAGIAKSSDSAASAIWAGCASSDVCVATIIWVVDMHPLSIAGTTAVETTARIPHLERLFRQSNRKSPQLLARRASVLRIGSTDHANLQTGTESRFHPQPE